MEKVASIGMHEDTPFSSHLFEDPNALLSVSVDIVGSTQAKSDIIAFQSKHGNNSTQFESYLRAAAAIEVDFYRCLQNLRVLELEDIFVVKNLGDEIWCVVPVDTKLPVLAQLVAHDMLEALNALFSRKVEYGFAVSEHEEDPREVDAWANVGEVQQIPLSVKATIDLLSEVVEYTDFRRRFVLDKLHIPYSRGTPAVAKLYENLNCGNTEVVQQSKIRFAVRTDYVGAHVDRFFRLASKALPGLITVGDDLYGLLDQGRSSKPEGINDKYYRNSYRVAVDDRSFFLKNRAAGAAEPSSSQGRFVDWLKREVPQLKGVAPGYGLRYCYSKPNLSPIMRQTDCEFFNSTRKRLAEAGIL